MEKHQKSKWKKPPKTVKYKVIDQDGIVYSTIYTPVEKGPPKFLLKCTSQTPEGD